MIPRIAAVSLPHALNERLWSLIAKERDGTISAPDMLELNMMFLSMDSEQDNREANHG